MNLPSAPPRTARPAGQPIENKQARETAVPMGQGPIMDQGHVEDLKARDNTFAGSAVEDIDIDAERASVPEAKRYIVLAEKKLTLGGQRFVLQEGKVIDDVNYSIPKLKGQGVKLRELKPGEEPDLLN